jgi:hypothetical protein
MPMMAFYGLMASRRSPPEPPPPLSEDGDYLCPGADAALITATGQVWTLSASGDLMLNGEVVLTGAQQCLCYMPGTIRNVYALDADGAWQFWQRLQGVWTDLGPPATIPPACPGARRVRFRSREMDPRRVPRRS